MPRSGRASTPPTGECLVCYVYRRWRAYGGGGDLSLVMLYSHALAVNDSHLVDRLVAAGVHDAAGLVFGAHHPRARYWNATGPSGPAADGVPRCLTVAAGSTAACHLWVRTTTWRVSGAGRRLVLWG